MSDEQNSSAFGAWLPVVVLWGFAPTPSGAPFLDPSALFKILDPPLTKTRPSFIFRPWVRVGSASVILLPVRLLRVCCSLSD